MMTYVTRSQGVHGSGARAYSPEQYQRVVGVILALPDGEAITVEALSAKTGISGRSVREIVSQADGVDFLLGGEGNGYRRALTAADARRLTARYESQAKRMQERSERRAAMATRL